MTNIELMKLHAALYHIHRENCFIADMIMTKGGIDKKTKDVLINEWDEKMASFLDRIEVIKESEDARD